MSHATRIMVIVLAGPPSAHRTRERCARVIRTLVATSGTPHAVASGGAAEGYAEGSRGPGGDPDSDPGLDIDLAGNLAAT